MLCGDIRKIMQLTQLRLQAKGKKNSAFFLINRQFSKSHISRKKKKCQPEVVCDSF